MVMKLVLDIILASCRSVPYVCVCVVARDCRLCTMIRYYRRTLETVDDYSLFRFYFDQIVHTFIATSNQHADVHVSSLLNKDR